MVKSWFIRFLRWFLCWDYKVDLEGEMFRDKSPLAGKTVKIKSGDLAGWHITIEDWWENVNGKSWMVSSFSAAVVVYTARVRRDKLPLDDDVVYGKALSCGGHGISLGYLVHISELEGGE